MMSLPVSLPGPIFLWGSGLSHGLFWESGLSHGPSYGQSKGGGRPPLEGDTLEGDPPLEGYTLEGEFRWYRHKVAAMKASGTRPIGMYSCLIQQSLVFS